MEAAPQWLSTCRSGALLLELALRAMRAAAAGAEPRPAPTREPALDRGVEGGMFTAFPDLLRSRTLLGICAYILLMTMSSTILYFVQAQIVSASFADEASRTAVFAGLDLGVNALTLGFAGTVAGACLTYWLGIRAGANKTETNA